MERRTDYFMMRVNEAERTQISQLAERAGRPASEVVRRLIDQAIKNDECQPFTGSDAQRNDACVTPTKNSTAV